MKFNVEIKICGINSFESAKASIGAEYVGLVFYQKSPRFLNAFEAKEITEYLGPDLVIFHSSGLSKSLIGPVENPETTPPVRASGQQSEFIAGVAAACSAMFGIFRKNLC